jgi:hypothetical protein
MHEQERWYWQVHGTSWVAYLGRRAVAEATDELGLRDQLTAKGYDWTTFRFDRLSSARLA